MVPASQSQPSPRRRPHGLSPNGGSVSSLRIGRSIRMPSAASFPGVEPDVREEAPGSRSSRSSWSEPAPPAHLGGRSWRRFQSSTSGPTSACTASRPSGSSASTRRAPSLRRPDACSTACGTTFRHAGDRDRRSHAVQERPPGSRLRGDVRPRGPTGERRGRLARALPRRALPALLRTARSVDHRGRRPRALAAPAARARIAVNEMAPPGLSSGVSRSCTSAGRSRR